jgi:ABC-2 type transport system ATP-binding protein
MLYALKNRLKLWRGVRILGWSMGSKNTEYAIEAKGITKSFGKLKVLDGVDLRVKRGTVFALLGPNGAGKTTTVRILTTLLRADGGTAKIAGYDVRREPDQVRELIGLTGQYAAVDEFLTGRENLHMMGRLYHLSKQDTVRRTDELLKQFDLVDAANRAVKTYSGGMRRRLDLASSLIASPPIVFLDEPTTGLDPRSRLGMWNVIRQLVTNGSTILLTTQYLEEADQLASRIAVIDGGKVIAEGTADELKGKVGKERIEFKFASATQTRRAAKVVDGAALQVDEGRRMVSLANDGGVKQLSSLLNKLSKSDLEPVSLSLHKPTLDDVFLHLTGHAAGTEEEKSSLTEGVNA